MFTKAPETSAELAAALLIHYSFDLTGYSAIELVNRWQNQYPLDWLHLAVIEALYQGRYKAISVQQILAFWQRREQPIHHFNMEFERLICSKFPEILTALTTPANEDVISENVANVANLPGTSAANDEYEQSQNASVQVIPRQTQTVSSRVESQRVKNLLASSTLSATTTGVKSRLNSQPMLPNGNSSSNPDKQPKLLTSSVNHPPIGQFTPETSDRSESFTSKLKAIFNEKPQRVPTHRQLDIQS
ncbi:hypothetical protein IQ259_01705 [Fortiea sp. LEGE XX443]|uniref:hypothetical protein n=1 Tax=Fortiea sp. LEGE XX443 TaxID=1828611 RepID=UPI00187EA584|nr:hypothetical protein [Fortiea sp. LEGE XX443]MBE9003776.1 hypothetical protein [Fortiea sp. LEGE XX443]